MSGPGPRGEPFSVREGITCGVIGAAVVVAKSARDLPSVFGGTLINPDSAMRLVRLRDMLAAGRALDVVSRDGSGHGVVVQWSHLLDSLLLLLASPLAPLLGWHAALRWTVPLFGPLCIAGLGAALAWAVAPIAERRWRLLAPVLAGIAPPVLSYGLPGVVHHHLLIALAAIMSAGWAGRAIMGVRGAGWRLGAWGAAGLWLSPEAAPLTLMTLAALALAWLLQLRDHGGDHGLAIALRDAGSSYLLLTAAALAADPPVSAAWTPCYDRLSVTWLALAGVCCLSGWLVWRGTTLRWPPWRAGLIGAAPLIAWFAAFPGVLRGTHAPLSPEEAHAFLDAISEFQPVRGLGCVEFLWTGLLAAALAAIMARRERAPVWLWAAACTVAVTALGAEHVRFATYPALLGCSALPVALTRCGTMSAERIGRTPALIRPGLVALFLAGPLLSVAAGGMGAAHATGSAEECSSPPASTLLAPAAGQVVLARPDETPDLLLSTNVLTAGSLYHRGIAAYMRARAAWRSMPSPAEPEAVRATEAHWVLICSTAPRSPLVADLPEATLEDRLREGRAPPWLQPAGKDAAGWVLWQVRTVSRP
jgi:hypothetical protein